jgi:glycosyltransferase involved in cell wall biosynthesis
LIHVLHIITDLSVGGAEAALLALLSATDRSKFKPEVVSLTKVGSVGEKIRALDVPVRALGMRPLVPNPFLTFRLTDWIRQDPPDVVQTWMYHADLIGGLAAYLYGRVPVVWNIRHTNLEPQLNKRTTLWIVSVCARLSHRVPRRIVCASHASREVHAARGYAAEKMLVIPNGFDLERFRPDLDARFSVRRELGISDYELAIGLIARFHPQKDHHNFIRAASLVHNSHPDLHFLLAGQDATWENQKLAEWIDSAALRDRCHLLGMRTDMPRIMASLDIVVSSSCGEGFPNVIGEAMACAVPCVVTDVGDSGLLVGDTGMIVPPRDPRALARGLEELIRMGEGARRALGKAARERVKGRFGLTKMALNYEELYAELANP